jgi:hypothetical protein
MYGIYKYICYMNQIKKWLDNIPVKKISNNIDSDDVAAKLEEENIKTKVLFDNLHFQNKELVKLYRGKFLHKLCSVHLNIATIQKKNKVFVFDMDETIGSFGEFILLHHSLERCLEKQPFGLDQIFFNELLDLYPDFLRYGILNIFNYLNQKKNTNECYKIYIYTNNKYSPELPQRINRYIDYKLQTNGFIDKLICAFKVGNKIIEPSRTTIEKSHHDFIQCTMLPKNTEICFVDNTLYSKMQHNKIFYIQPKNYYHKMEWQKIINIFLQSPLYIKYFNLHNKNQIYDYLNNQKYETNIHEMQKQYDRECDMQVYHRLMCYVKEFFFLTTRRAKTKKIKYNLGRFTRKNKYMKNNKK